MSVSREYGKALDMQIPSCPKCGELKLSIMAMPISSFVLEAWPLRMHRVLATMRYGCECGAIIPVANLTWRKL